MGIEAKVLLDSINPSGDRITTWIMKYPRFIHSEFMTHRVLSRNAASSRAIPIEKMLKVVTEVPAMPDYWGKNQPGMQADEELSPEQQEAAKKIWLRARDDAVRHVRGLSEIPAHKQIANRILEPWFYITVLATATDYENLFSLRAHKDAQPEFKKLAYTALDAYNASVPILRKPGEWHVPFADVHCEGLTLEQQLRVGTARAARVSYANFDGKIDPAKDYDLHDKLRESGHWSPFEHSARAMSEDERQNKFYLVFDGEKIPGVCKNFVGWVQYRAQFKGENRKDPRVLKK